MRAYLGMMNIALVDDKCNFETDTAMLAVTDGQKMAVRSDQVTHQIRMSPPAIRAP